MKKSITIVTAFFDIGRGNWGQQTSKTTDRLKRTNDTYFSYFIRLAKLENKLVVFTSSDLEEKILSLRKGLPTKVVVIDLEKKFKFTLKKILQIQQSESFKKLISPELLKNPEYWSPEYVLINNLKPFFVKRAIELGFTDNQLVSWVDFGYIRNGKTLYGVKEWYHPFNEKKIHFFSIKNTLNLMDEKAVLEKVLSNDPHIIGGVLLASKDKWSEFFKIVFETQKKFLKSGIIDDDQGVFLTCASQHPATFQLNYLGHMRWFRTFRLFHKGSKTNYLIRLAILLRIIK